MRTAGLGLASASRSPKAAATAKRPWFMMNLPYDRDCPTEPAGREAHRRHASREGSKRAASGPRPFALIYLTDRPPVLSLAHGQARDRHRPSEDSARRGALLRQPRALPPV